MKKFFIFLILASLLLLSACSKENNNYKILMVEKYSSECSACMSMDPVVRKLERKYKKDLKIVRYDVEKPDELEKTRDYESKIIPAFFFMDSNGNRIKIKEGAMPPSEFESILKELGIKE